MKRKCLTVMALSMMLIVFALSGYGWADAGAGGTSPAASWGENASYGSSFVDQGDNGTCHGHNCGGGGHHPHPVPEPSSLLLLAGGLVAFAVLLSKARHT